MVRILAAGLFLLLTASATAQTNNGWSNWINHRQYVQFQFRTIAAGPGVMKMQIRVRPNVEALRANPNISGQSYHVEYFQTMGTDQTGGQGDTSEARPRRVMFPAGAGESCVFEDMNGVFAIDQGPGSGVRLYRKEGFTIPILSMDGEEVSGVEHILSIGERGTGHRGYVRQANLSTYQAAC